MGELFAAPRLERPTTVSLGVVPLSEETKSLDRLIAMADAEMYRSKKTGKNRASVIRKSVGDA